MKVQEKKIWKDLNQTDQRNYFSMGKIWGLWDGKEQEDKESFPLWMWKM